MTLLQVEQGALAIVMPDAFQEDGAAVGLDFWVEKGVVVNQEPWRNRGSCGWFEPQACP